MSEIKEISEEELKKLEEKVKKKFEQSGFSTEEQTALALTKNDWYVLRNVKYYHETERKYKEIDIVANKIFHKSTKLPVSITLVIECKKQEKHPWIFPIGNTKVDNPLSVTFMEKGIKLNSDRVKKKFQDHYYYGRDAVTFSISPFYFDGSRKNHPDPIKKAIDQVLDGLYRISYIEEKLRKKPILCFFYPVIVLNGDLLSYSDGRLNRESHISYLTNISLDDTWRAGGFVTWFKQVVIDIVKLSYFEDFLGIVERNGMIK